MHAMLPGGGGKIVHEYANYLVRRGSHRQYRISLPQQDLTLSLRPFAIARESAAIGGWLDPQLRSGDS